MTGRRAREIIALLWVLSFIIGLIPFLGWNKKDSACRGANNRSAPGNGSGPSCRLTCYFESVVDMRYMVYCNFLGCVLPPLLLMLAVYAQIFSVARRQLRLIGGGDAGGSQSLLQHEVRAAKSLSIIVGLFALCWLPVHVLNLLTHFRGDLRKPPAVMYLAIVLSHANSAVNPAIYAYRIQEFRRTFRRIVFRKVLCRRDEPYAGSGSSVRSRDLTTFSATFD
ncbi:adenosine receptor A2b-like isoform X2 [Conger conger]|nr:adenosine receptor A2b-like isoform X2 [Conger conger]